jgi:hypothetical protein
VRQFLLRPRLLVPGFGVPWSPKDQAALRKRLRQIVVSLGDHDRAESSEKYSRNISQWQVVSGCPSFNTNRSQRIPVDLTKSSDGDAASADFGKRGWIIGRCETAAYRDIEPVSEMAVRRAYRAAAVPARLGSQTGETRPGTDILNAITAYLFRGFLRAALRLMARLSRRRRFVRIVCR